MSQMVSSQCGGQASCVHPQAAHRKRRERELASLYASARALTALVEVDDVLATIVRHAHELLGTDLTYLSLIETATGELIAKASAGTISSAFKNARVPAGTGVGGRIIETASAHWVSNYLDEHSLRHDSGFDQICIAEGLVALLGVPLVVAGQVVGVLFAANRAERPFETDEVALLRAFADHAAVSLDNARLYEQSRAMVQQLQGAYESIEFQVATMERAASLDEALTSAVLTGGGPGDIAQLLVDHLHGWVTIFDRSDAMVVSRSSTGNAKVHSLNFPMALMSEVRRGGRCKTLSDAQDGFHSVAPIRAADTYLGALILTRTTAPQAVDERTMERAAQIMGLLILKQDALVEAEERVRGELLTEILISNRPLDSTQRSRAMARGVNVDDLNVIVVAESNAKPTSAIVRRLRGPSSDWSGLIGEHAGRATMLISAPDAGAAAQAIHRRLRRELGVPVTVVAEPVHSGDWSRAFDTASRCTAVVRALGDGDKGTTTDDYVMFGLLFDAAREGELERFLDDNLGALIDYDARRATDLLGTVSAYFANSGNLAQTARGIHVHMNTLLKRLDRIEALLETDWRAPGTALRLHMAVRLHELRSLVD